MYIFLKKIRIRKTESTLFYRHIPQFPEVSLQQRDGAVWPAMCSESHQSIFSFETMAQHPQRPTDTIKSVLY